MDPSESLASGRAIDLCIGERVEGPIFIGRNGQRLDRQAAWRVVRRRARKAGINKPVGPHALRHGFITAALDAGVPLSDVRDAASHADPRTTTVGPTAGTAFAFDALRSGLLQEHATSGCI